MRTDHGRSNAKPLNYILVRFIMEVGHNTDVNGSNGGHGHDDGDIMVTPPDDDEMWRPGKGGRFLLGSLDLASIRRSQCGTGLSQLTPKPVQNRNECRHSRYSSRRSSFEDLPAIGADIDSNRVDSKWCRQAVAIEPNHRCAVYLAKG